MRRNEPAASRPHKQSEKNIYVYKLGTHHIREATDERRIRSSQTPGTGK